MNNTATIQKNITTFSNGVITNRVIKFENYSSSEKCIFIPNWRAKPHHWDGFCNHLAENINLDYFETREKPATTSTSRIIDHANEKAASDIINYINATESGDYHLILCSFSAPLVFSQWDKLANKPQSLVLICPIYEVNLPWPVRLFSQIPKFAFPILYKSVFSLTNKSKTMKAICKNNLELFKHGDMQELMRFQSAVKEVLKLKIAYTDYKKTDMPTLIIKPLSDKIHSPIACQKIKNSIRNSMMMEVENFREAHSVEVAKQVFNFINEQSKIACI